MGKINVLDKKIAELIAAGEVIERPCSVIKELVENSIDSGSDSITIEIKNGGTTFMKVSDNGSGIARDDVRNAFLRHATSKIKDSDDLIKISTLGFRGEALASISAVSKVEVFTRTESEFAGTHYIINGSEEVLIEDVGCAKGVTIIIRDLFYNVPARMKFLKKDVSEANSIAAIIDRIALSHPEVAFKFIRDGREELNTQAKGDIKSCIYCVYGSSFCENLIDTNYTRNGIEVHGFISSPKFCRPNRSMQHFFVNGRYVKSKTAMVALEQAFKGSIMTGKFPACVLYINIPCEATDVNVHPAKLEIRFVDEKPIFDAVYYAVKSALSYKDISSEIVFKEVNKTKSNEYIDKTQNLSNKTAGKIIQFDNKNDNMTSFGTSYLVKDKKFESKSKGASDLEDIYIPPKPVFSNKVVKDITDKAENADKLKENYYINKADLIIGEEPKEKSIVNVLNSEKAKEKDKNYNKKNTNIDSLFGKPEKKILFIGEVFSNYIILEYGEDELILIDKHAAHERLIYEKLKAENNETNAQILLSPVTVTLDKNEYATVLQNKDVFFKAGFEIEDFGSGTIIVRSAPLYIGKEDVYSSIVEMAGYILENKKDISTEYLDWLYHNIACRSAIKAGEKQNHKELIELVKKLCENSDVKYCPHGRPIHIVLKKKEIEKQFGRV